MSGLEQFPLVDGLEFSHPNTISPYLTGRLEYSYLKNADGTSAYCMRIYNAILLRTGTFPANAMRTFFTAEMKQWLQTLRVTVFDQLLFLSNVKLTPST